MLKPLQHQTSSLIWVKQKYLCCLSKINLFTKHSKLKKEKYDFLTVIFSSQEMLLKECYESFV